MALEHGQVRVRDLVMGEGTEWEIIDFDPWTRSVRADQSGPRAWNHGSWSGAEWLESVPLQWHVCQDAQPDPNECDDYNEFIAKYDAWIDRQEELTAAFEPIADGITEIELRWRYGSREYLMFGRPRLVDPDTEWIQWVRAGGVVVTLAFLPLNPRRFSAELFTVTLGLPEYGGGMALTEWLPIYLGSKIEGEAQLTNLGKAPAPLQIRIDGPAPRPRVILHHPDGTVQTLFINFDVPADQFVEIDTGSHAVLLNGNANRRNQVSGQFPLAPTGTSTIGWTAQTFDEDALMTVSWRYTW